MVYLNEGQKYYIEAIMYNSAMYNTQNLVTETPPDPSSGIGGSLYNVPLADPGGAAPISNNLYSLYLSISVSYLNYKQLVPMNFISPLLLIGKTLKVNFFIKKFELDCFILYKPF